MKLLDAYKVVKTAMKNRIPVFLWGPPGIGKSALIKQIGEEMVDDLKNILDIRLAQVEPTDLRGVPMPDREIQRAIWFLPVFWPEAAKEETTRKIVTTDSKGNPKTSTVKVPVGYGVNGPGIVFFDEMEKAPVSVKNASLQIVYDRKVADYRLPEDWPIVCAGNREEDGCFSAPLGSALSNRMIHLEIEPDIESWAAWARDNGIEEDIIGFLHFKTELLYKQTEDHAFPSPRSWEMGSRLISSVKTQKEQKELLAAAVGRGAASEYTVWSNVYKSVDPEAVFAGHMPDFNGKDQSFKYAVAMAVAFSLRKRKNNIKKAEDNIAKFLKILSPELRVVLLRQQGLPCMEAMAKHPAFKELKKSIMSVVC